MNNIEAFDLTTATIFAKLYESFPKKILVDCMDFCKELDIPGYELETKMNMCRNTVIFLEENDFIVASPSINSPAFSAVSLTMKGLAALKSTPKTLNKDETIGSKLIKAVKEGAITKTPELAIMLAQNALNALIK